MKNLRSIARFQLRGEGAFDCFSERGMTAAEADVMNLRIDIPAAQLQKQAVKDEEARQARLVIQAARNAEVAAERAQRIRDIASGRPSGSEPAPNRYGYGAYIPTKIGDYHTEGLPGIQSCPLAGDALDRFELPDPQLQGLARSIINEAFGRKDIRGWSPRCAVEDRLNF